MNYQIYIDRGDGLALDGCWGSESAKFERLEEARSAVQDLSTLYPYCAWVICDIDGREIERFQHEAVAERQMA